MQNELEMREYLLQYAEAFSVSIGIGVALLGSYGEKYGEFGVSCHGWCNHKGESYCQCEDTHLYGILQSYQQKERIEYTCLSGASFFVVPIKREQEETPYFLKIGPYIKESFDMKEFFQEQLIVLSENSILKMSFLLSAMNLSGHQTNIVQAEKENKSYITEMLSALQAFQQPQEKAYFQNQMVALRKLMEENEGNHILINGKVNELLGYLFYGLSASFSIMKARILELLLVFVKDTVYETRLEEIYHLTTKQELSVWLARNMSNMIEYALRVSFAKHSDTIKKAIEYMKVNVSQRISLEQAAATVYLSPTYFSKIFREHTGDTFSSYLNKLRVQKSKRMLEKTQQSLVKIASQCGFEDDSYFNKVFKRYTGLTPKQYRNEYGKEKESGME